MRQNVCEYQRTFLVWANRRAQSVLAEVSACDFENAKISIVSGLHGLLQNTDISAKTHSSKLYIQDNSHVLSHAFFEKHNVANKTFAIALLQNVGTICEIAVSIVIVRSRYV